MEPDACPCLDRRGGASIRPMNDSSPANDQVAEQRIAQFENMTAADPENEMAHFSLGNAYRQAGRAAEAAASFQRVV